LEKAKKKNAKQNNLKKKWVQGWVKTDRGGNGRSKNKKF